MKKETAIFLQMTIVPMILAIIVVMVSAFLIIMVREEFDADVAKTQTWAKESQCTLAESYFGIVNKWDCEDGSSHWRGP